MAAEQDFEKLKKELAKSRAEIAALQRKLQAEIIKRNSAAAQKTEPKRPTS
jgi:hypothetical protein